MLATESQEFDVFLSHHSGDKPWVIALKAALVQRGVSVWLDQDEIRPGDLFIDAIDRGVERSRCVAVIVSPESLRSAWVREEYQRALVLANSAGRELRIIPCVMRNAELPGFLATRHWIDFRDPRQFEARVDDLVRGITGGAPRPAAPSAPAAGVTPGEIAFLERSIAAVRKERSQLTLLRAAAPILGLGAGLLWPAGYGMPAALPPLACTIVTGLLGIGVTARQWSARGDELRRLSAHRDALELCASSFSAVCPEVVDAFNRLLKRRIGIDAAEVEARA